MLGIILTIVMIIAVIVIVYPLYVHIVGTQYAQDMSNVFGAKDINQVDKFLNQSTVIAIKREDALKFDEILYEDSREYIKKMIKSEKFDSLDSYGHIGELDNKYKSRQRVEVHWSISEVGMVDTTVYLKRKFIFWYSIERIEISDRDGYFKKMFLGENMECFTSK